MQKKILLSLLVASPASLPALANIDYGHGTWESEGLSSDDKVSIDSEKGNVSCVLGSGPTKWIVKEFLPGKYQLSFTTIENLAITVTQNGKTLAEATGKDVVEFETEESGEITITARGITANAYSFTGANLQLIFDFQEVGAALQTQLDGIEEYVTISDEKYPGAKELLDAKAVLVKQAEEYQNTINSIKDEATSATDLEKLYKEQELYKNPSKISANISALAKAVKDWNEQASALNEKIQTADNNAATKATLLEEQKTLLTSINALIEKIKGGSQYGQDADLNAAETLKTDIENYGKDINTAYADDKLAGEITFENQNEALQNKIDELTAKWNADEADWNAYSTFMNTVFPKLQNAATDAENAINALSGVKGYKNVFDDQKEKAVTNVKTAFDNAKAALNITSAEGAAAKLEGDQKTVDGAIAAINAIVDEITNLVTTQNDNKEAAATKINGLNSEFVGYQSKIVPTELEEAYNEAKENIENLLGELQDYVAGEYEKAQLDLTSSDYTDKVQAVEDALASFRDLVAPIQEINKLAQDFEDAKTYVKGVSDKLGTDFINLYNLFDAEDGTFASIENAIKKLSTVDEVNEEKDAIEEAIADAKATADKLAEVFTQLQAADVQYKTDVDDLKAFVNAKVEIDKTGANATVLKDAFMAKTGEGGIFVAAQEQFNADLKALAAEGKKPQAIYDAAVKLSEDNITVNGEEVEYKWQSGLETIKTEFAKNVTDSNKANLDLILQAAKDYVAEGTYKGQDTLNFDEIDPKVTEIADAIAAAADAEDPVEAYGDADEDILKLIPEINAVKTKADQYKQNQKDYDALVAQLGTPGLQEKINQLILQNAKESKDGGKDYFDNLINGAGNKNSLQAQLDGIKGDLNTALGEFADPKKNVTGNKDALQAKIDALQALIVKTATDITNNNTAHTKQLNTAEEVAEYIVTALNTLEEYYKNQGGVEDWYDATKEKITTLRDEDLFNNNVAVANAYGEGASYTKDSELTGEYERIYNEVESIVNGMLDEYTKAVVAANGEVVKAAEWDRTKTSMNDEYVKAITVFNSYYYGLTNPGWKEAVIAEVERHQDIYQYSQAINDLIAEVNQYIKDNNEAPVTFTAKDFADNATEKANALIEEMQAKVQALNESVAQLAVKYYDNLHGTAETQINGYQTQLDNAGIEGDYLDEVKGALQDAETKYAAANAEEATEPLGLAMDRIADDLDKALQPIDLQTIAEEAWDKAYSDAKNIADEILSGLNDSANEDYKFADTELREDAANQVSEKIEDMVELNAEVSDVDEDLIDSYKNYKEQLDELLSAIQGLGQSVKDDSSNNKANEDLYKTLTGTTIPGLEDAYKALVEYSQSLAGGQTFDTASIKSQIDALKNYVESHTGSLASNNDKITSDCTAIENAIQSGYPQIGSNEYDYLSKTLLDKVKVAFNDAKAAFMGAEGTESNLDKETGMTQIDNWNNEIDELATKIAALNTSLNPDNFDKTGFQKTAQGLETALSDLYVAMEQTWTGDNHDGSNPAANIIAELEEQYNEVKDAISNVEAYLEGCEEGLDTSDFEKSLAAAAASLDAEKAAWEAAGNRVITMQPTYSANLDAIADDVEEILASAQKANEEAIAQAQAKAANEAAYATLSSELDELRNDLARVSETAHNWYADGYDGTIEWISGLIDAAEEDLQTKYDKTQLTASSKLLNGTQIETQIVSLERQLTTRKANDTRQQAYTALYEAQYSLFGHLVPEEREVLQGHLNGLNAAYYANYDKQTNTQNPPTIKDNYEIIAEYERIAEAAAELRGTAEENSYVPGDVDLNPDGQVTSADVQMLIRWVLEGKTWQELKEENPRQAYAADLNGDQDLNITDVTMDISLMFGEQPSTLKASRMASIDAAAVESQNGIGMELVSEENGVRRFAVLLTNTDRLIAGQLDLKLPNGMTVKDIRTTERTEGHAVESLEQDFNTVRVVLYSMDNAVIEGESGAIIYVDVEGTGDIKTTNVVFTDQFFNTLGMAGTEGTTFIDSVVNGAKEMRDRFYNAAGVMFNKLQNGINIFRDKDGKTKKEYHRK